MITRTKKFITLALLSIAFMPALHCFDMQREYPYLSLLIHNANADAFKKKLDQLAIAPGTRSPEFREMLTTLDQDVDRVLVNTRAMHGADVGGSITDKAWSQCKWGVGELALAAAMFKFKPEYKEEIAQKYYTMFAVGLYAGLNGVSLLKNGIVDYFFARRYGQHIQKTIASLEEIKKHIALCSKA